MAKFDLVLKGGTIIDGLQTPRYRSDIGIKDGKIAEISSNIPEADAQARHRRAGPNRGPWFR